jgi:hypothetical protein
MPRISSSALLAYPTSARESAAILYDSSEDILSKASLNAILEKAFCWL